jgi:hypothetical protein
MKKSRDLSPRLRVRRCRRRASVLLLPLLAAAAVFVPVRVDEVAFQRDPQTNHVWRTTAGWSAYLLLPRYLGRDRSPFPGQDSYPVRYALRRAFAVKETRARLDWPVVLAEAAGLLLLAVFDWLIFCRRRRRGGFVSLSAPR